MVIEAASFVDDYKAKRPARWLSFVGTSGAGKTFLAKLIIEKLGQRWRTESGHEWVERWPVFHWPRLSDKMKAGNWYCADGIPDQPSLIDDIGADHDPSRAVASKLSRVMDDCLGKWLLVTSNWGLASIAEKIDTRIASRMLRGGNQVVDVDVPDFNMRVL